MEFYFEVDDIEAVWDYMKDKLSDIKFKPPLNREYGMREVHIVIPETKALLFIGQQLQ